MFSRYANFVFFNIAGTNYAPMSLSQKRKKIEKSTEDNYMYKNKMLE